MSEGAEFALDQLSAPGVIDEVVEIFLLPRQGVARERARLRKGFAIGPNAASGKVESDSNQPAFGQLLREVWEEPPVGETLESVTEHNRADR
jgi:hypothetical protein